MSRHTMRIIAGISELAMLQEHLPEGILAKAGDTKLIWDSNVPEEVDNARETFERLTSHHYNAYAVKENGKPGKVVTEFDPEAERIILSRPLSGG